MSKLFGRFYCKVSGIMCRVRLRNPPVPSPYTVKETLRNFIGVFGELLYWSFLNCVRLFLEVQLTQQSQLELGR